MIKELSSSAAGWLEQEGAISGEDHTLFAYAAYSLLFGLLPIFIVTVLGTVFGMLREGLLMILPFMLIRKFSGGYHLNSSRQCIIFSCALLTLALVIVKVILYFNSTSLLMILVTLSMLSLCHFSPVDNDARKLSEKERRQFRKIAQILSASMFATYTLLRIVASINYATPIGVGILLAAFLQILCIFRESVRPKLRSALLSREK